MKQTIRNFIALSLLVAYSLSSSVSIQNFIINNVLDTDQHHNVAVNLQDSKTSELSIFPDLEPLGEIVTESTFSFQKVELKAIFKFSKHLELYALAKDNQYLYKSKNIQPGLDIKAILYPFHTFS